MAEVPPDLLLKRLSEGCRAAEVDREERESEINPGLCARVKELVLDIFGPAVQMNDCREWPIPGRVREPSLNVCAIGRWELNRAPRV